MAKFRKFFVYFNAAIILVIAFAGIASANYLFYNAGTGRSTFGGIVEMPGLYVSGNVGIGTASPTNALTVKNNGTSNTIIMAQGSTATANSEQYIALLNDDASQNIYLEVNGSTNTTGAGSRTYAPRLESNGTRGLGISAYQGPLNFWTGVSVNVMTMTTGGNVGIGTTGPVEKLEVNGAVKIQNFRVKQISAAQLGIYDSGNNLILIFDEGN